MQYGCHSMVGKLEAVLIKRPENAFVSQAQLEADYKKYHFLGCPDFNKVCEEYNRFEAILQDHVKDVFYLPYDERAGLDSIYTQDPVKITRQGAIYFSMGKALRHGEPEAVEQYLLSLGIPTLGRITPPGKMEGGDVLWLNARTVAIGRGYRTNDEGIRQFKELIKDMVDEVIVVPLPHGHGPNSCMHLSSLFSLVSEDKAVLFSQYMPVDFRERLVDMGIRLIECNHTEYDYLGCDVLALAPNKVILIRGCPSMEAQLSSAGVKVYTYEGMELSFRGTGGPVCLTCCIARE